MDDKTGFVSLYVVCYFVHHLILNLDQFIPGSFELLFLFLEFAGTLVFTHLKIQICGTKHIALAPQLYHFFLRSTLIDVNFELIDLGAFFYLLDLSEQL